MGEIDLEAKLGSIAGVNAKVAEKLSASGILSVADLLWHTPIRCEDWKNVSPISDLVSDQFFVVRGVVKKIVERRIWRRRLSIIEAIVEDSSSSIRVVWFNQAYVKKGFKLQDEIIISGKVSVKNDKLFFTNPNYVVIGEDFVPQIVPVYRRPKGVSSKTISTLIAKLMKGVVLEEFIPDEILKKQKLLEINRSLKSIHFPESILEWQMAKKRFSFESLFLMQLGSLIQKKKLSEMTAPKIVPNFEVIKKDLEALPFQFTFAQKRVLFEILKDFEAGIPMNRLMQGDVGSGKTIVAYLASKEVLRAGYQVAMMAPTEILATQHYESAKKILGDLNVPIVLLTSKIARVYFGDGLESNPKKAEVIREIKSGKFKFVIGTHSLIVSKTNALHFQNAGLFIIDEQQRFGVNERSRLIEMGRVDNFSSHFLSMSATPIPRTLAIAMFGDLDLSVIDELPKNRKPIKVKVVSQNEREKAYSFIKSEIKNGRQAFVVCALIDSNSEEMESDDQIEAKTVKAEYEKLSKDIFPELKIGMLHGKMKSPDKVKIMTAFKNREIDILVSTSVIEVGVDIPNASIMMIESADKFGLSQLYQFKGRVGRGEYQSYCLLFTDSNSEQVAKRLDAIVTAENGFQLAEKDLAIRGPGEFLGSNQKGMPDVTMKALQDSVLIKEAREGAKWVLEGKIDYKTFTILKKKIDHFQKSFHLE